MPVLVLTSPQTQCATPTISPNGGSFSSAQTVTLASTAGASIYYTLDGSTPTPASTLYTAPFSVTASATLNCAAFYPGVYLPSAIAIATFTIGVAAATPTFSPAAGTYLSAQTVTVTSTAGSTIYYTIDGSTPVT
jgi:hypothetical protein